MAGTQVRRILVKVDTGGDKSLNSLKNSFKELNKTTKETKSVFESLQRTFNAVLGASVLGFGVRELANIADSYQKLSDRITVFEGSQEAANRTLEGLAAIADRTKSSIDGIATVYTRLAFSLKETGIDSQSLLFFTEQLQNSFRLSGSTAAEATAATIQLAQGLASGQLRGQELRSVLEQNVVVGGLLADQFGTTRGKLLKLAEAGKITNEQVLQALLKGAPKLAKDVEGLGVTFSEAVDRGVNKFTIALGKLNKELGLSSGFDKAVQNIIGNLGALAAVATGLALTALPALISALQKLYITLSANPIGLLLFAIGTGASYAYFETDKFVGLALEAREAFVIFGIEVNKFLFTILKYVATLTTLNGDNPLARFFQSGIDGADELKKASLARIQEIRDASESITKGNDPFAAATESIEKQIERVRKKLAKLNFGNGDEPLSIKKQIDALNTAFVDGLIPVEKYNAKLLKLTEELNKKRGTNAVADAIAKIKKENLGRLFEEGTLDIQNYKLALQQLNLDELTSKFQRGKISVAEYNKELTEMSDKFRPGAAIYTGINNYIESSGTLAQNVAKNITLVFNTLEDTLVEFVKTGTFEFKKFATAVLDDLTRIIIRAAVIQPLAQGILGSFSGPGAGAGQTAATSGLGSGQAYAAKGFAPYGSGVSMFANGGVVSSPTMFGYGGGKTGIMGEAGSEAILPLSRGSDGKLGVSGGGSNVVINVINTSDAQIQQTESVNSNGDKEIQLLIHSTVKNGLNSGVYDSQFRNQFGLSRKGR